jgi:septum formation protein
VRLVLASASPARLSVLRSAGLEPEVEVSEVDEDALLTGLPGASPAQTVTALASAKATAVARRVADRLPEAVVVGCDSMLYLGGELAGKPRDVGAARARWRAMAGGTGELLTGHAVLRLHDGGIDCVAEGHAATTVRFGRPDPVELEAYLASGEALAVAGAFTLDGLGGWFVDGVDGDPSNVIGISLPLTRRLLAGVGVRVTDLWRPAGRE